MKKNQKVFVLQPDYPLGYSDQGQYERNCVSSRVIVKIKEGKFLGTKKDTHFNSVYEIIILKNETTITEIYMDDIYDTKGKAEIALTSHNKEAFAILGERVLKLEGKVEEILNWANDCNLNT